MPEGVTEPEVIPPVVEPVPEIPEPPESPPVIPVEEGEPGGDTPEAVFARKQYREAKTARAEAQTERDTRIREVARLEEQMRLIKESQGKKEPEPQVTVEVIGAAVQSGEITADRGQYLIGRLAARDEREEADRQQVAARPIQRAAAAITEYRDNVSWIDSPSDPNYLAAKREYDRLVEFGYAPNLLTSLQAIEKVAGPIGNLKARKQMDENTRRAALVHVESPGGGGGGGGEAQSNAISKVPKALIESWRASGATDVQLKKYAEHHLGKMERRRATVGG